MQYIWQITQLERKISNNFVLIVHYRVTAIDGNYSAFTYDTVSYTQSEESFIPFDNLTEEIVIGWVQNSLNKDEIEANLALQVKANIVSQTETENNQTTVSGLPWNKGSE